MLFSMITYDTCFKIPFPVQKMILFVGVWCHVHFAILHWQHLQVFLHMRFQHALRDEATRWNIRVYNEIYIEDLSLRYFRELSNMIYEELNETSAAHDDSISFMAVIIMSCSEQTYMLLCFLGCNNKQYFKEFGAKLGMNDPMDVNKHQWSWSQHFLFSSSQTVMSWEQRWLCFKVLVTGKNNILEKTVQCTVISISCVYRKQIKDLLLTNPFWKVLLYAKEEQSL